MNILFMKYEDMHADGVSGDRNMFISQNQRSILLIIRTCWIWPEKGREFMRFDFESSSHIGKLSLHTFRELPLSVSGSSSLFNWPLINIAAIKKLNDFIDLPPLTNEMAEEVLALSAFKSMKKDPKSNYSWLDDVSDSKHVLVRESRHSSPSTADCNPSYIRLYMSNCLTAGINQLIASR